MERRSASARGSEAGTARQQPHESIPSRYGYAERSRCVKQVARRLAEKAEERTAAWALVNDAGKRGTPNYESQPLRIRWAIDEALREDRQ